MIRRVRESLSQGFTLTAYDCFSPFQSARQLQVWVRWDARLVRIFNHRWEQVALHVRQEAGRFSTLAEHIAPEKISGVERGAEYLLSKVQWIGPQAHQWAQAMLHARGIEGTRVLQGLLSLTKKHSSAALDAACQTALSHGAFRLKTLRSLLARRAATQEPLPFLEEHPIIRPLDDYAAVVAEALRRQADRSSMSEGFLRHDRSEASGRGAAKRPEDQRPQAAVMADLLPPSSEYPSSSCPSAELDSVSPDTFTLIRSFPFDQELEHE